MLNLLGSCASHSTALLGGRQEASALNCHWLRQDRTGLQGRGQRHLAAVHSNSWQWGWSAAESVSQHVAEVVPPFPACMEGYLL